MNAVEIEEAVSKLVEASFDAAEFPYAFLEAFGNKDATIRRLRSTGKNTTNKTDVDGDGVVAVLQRNNIHIAAIHSSGSPLPASDAEQQNHPGSPLPASGRGVGGEGLAREIEGDYEVDSDDELLDALGVSLGDGSNDDITTMKHVRTASQRNAKRTSPDEVAQRKPCEDFDDFRPDFDAVQADIETGRQTTELYRTSTRTKISKGDWFIVDGHKALVADADKWFMPEPNKPGQKVERDRRLRVIFDNGTESDLLLRSLRRALQKDEASRRIVPPQPETDEDYTDVGPLFSDSADDDDQASGTIYVARSLSGDAFIQENRDVLHKIGVTGGNPATRIAGAKKDPTFLLADAELVATYQLANINRKALEATLHKFFAKARLDVALADRFGDKVHPREWFLVPLPVIAEVVDRIKDGSISEYRYDAATASLNRVSKS